MSRLSYKEVEKLLDRIIKAEILMSKLEGRTKITGVREEDADVRDLELHTARGRILQFTRNYNAGEVRLRDSILWALISNYPVKLSFRDFQRFCKHVYKKQAKLQEKELTKPE
jgi:hypothetical protein